MKIERLLIMLTEEELGALDDWCLRRRMPGRAAAARELLARGLAAQGTTLANDLCEKKPKRQAGSSRRRQ